MHAWVRSGAFFHPKFHWLVHLPRHLARWGQLPTCWVHERKHRVVKRYASDICNTRAFERSILGEITAHQLEALKLPMTFSETIGLLDPKPAPLKMKLFLESELGVAGADCHTAREARISPFAVSCKGDVVLLRDEDSPENSTFSAGRVCFHACYGGEHVSLVSIWTRISYDSSIAAAEWQEIDNPVLVPTSDIVTSMISTRIRIGVIRTLIPCHLHAGM